MINIDMLIKALNTYGKTIQFISEKSFENNIKVNTSNEILESFITDLDYKDNLDYTTHITINNNITNAYMEKLGISWPNITKEYLKTFLRDMI